MLAACEPEAHVRPWQEEEYPTWITIKDTRVATEVFMKFTGISSISAKTQATHLIIEAVNSYGQAGLILSVA
jgi:hypothetical protein